MKLTKAQITNFRSVEDSGVFEIGNLTCLVGKNEAGKTAIMRALQGVYPSDDFEYDRTRDYPRRYLSKFEERHPNGSSEVAKTWWQLDDDEVRSVETVLGAGVLRSREVVVTRSIDQDNRDWIIDFDQAKCLEHFVSKHKLDAAERNVIRHAETTQSALKLLQAHEGRTEKHDALIADLAALREGNTVLAAINILFKNLPRFFYTSHFERMSGEVALNKLAQDKEKGCVSPGDRIFLDFLEYAGTTIEELRAARKYEDLVAQCEGASNDITDEIFDFWSQNEALAVRIELGEGRPEDEPPFNNGTVAKVRIENKHHRASVPLSERSAGFVWFFSFLAQFKQLKKTAGKAILLLDEPGLTLHGKAQSDLLRYIEERLLPEHQVIFTTHSPFMVPAQRLADVRVVEDVIDYRDVRRPVVKGTKVSSDVLSVDEDTLFPLQAHLGYEITQSLFVGKHNLLVEGPSDVLYLQAASRALKARGRPGLDTRWTICPTGGLDKVSSFASLFSGQNLNIATLCDYGSGDKAKVERLRQSQILKAGRVLTAADITNMAESDIEDFFTPQLYCQIVNAAYDLPGQHALTPEKVAAAGQGTPRIVKQVEAAFKLLPADIPEFDHFTPANWLLRHPEVLDADSPEVAAALDHFDTAFHALNAFLD